MVVFKGKEYLTKREFAEAIDMSYNTVTAWVDRGLFAPAYVSEKGRQFFTQEQVDAYWNGEYAPVRKRRSYQNGVSI